MDRRRSIVELTSRKTRPERPATLSPKPGNIGDFAEKSPHVVELPGTFFGYVVDQMTWSHH